MTEHQLLERITINPAIFSGKPIIRDRRLAVEHVLGMLAAGDDFETLLEGYPWLEREDILACLAYAHRLVEHERVEPLIARFPFVVRLPFGVLTRPEQEHAKKSR